MKKKTPTQKYIDEAAKKAAELVKPSVNMVGCTINNEPSEAIKTIAEALLENANALGKLSDAVNAPVIHIGDRPF